ncbi:tRNA modification GTPase MnmE [Candidatus Ecksteinia adelgidicola]|nr:tRNA modification GTPase MnmE [Candidatus Ecksteinia adelgidicola]
MYNTDTIVAQATPIGISGVGILRISGNKAKEVALLVLGKIPKARYAEYLSFRDNFGNLIDQGIALWFPNPNSFTGEDVLELQGHGGPVILDLLLRCILSLPHLRIAQPGEFSERAFLNNKIDLAQAESVIDLIESNSKQAARSAINSLQGAFSRKINQLVKSLIDLRVLLEAEIDFSDEDISFLSNEKISVDLNIIINNVDNVFKEAMQGSLLREGIKVVIVGRPNAGKSSLFNALSRQKLAIVSNTPGTTRDVLHEHIYIDGMPLHISDTAGLREEKTCNEIENIGIQRAWDEINQADKILFVVDSTTNMNTNLSKIWPEFVSFMPKNFQNIIIIRNKIDLRNGVVSINKKENGSVVIDLSVKTGKGVDVLCNFLKKNIGFTNNIEGTFLARRRHIEALKKARWHLLKGKKNLIHIHSYELLAEELKLAQNLLSQITGAFTSEDLRKRIFSKFCVGK